MPENSPVDPDLPAGEPLLKLDNLDLGYGELQVVFNVSLQVGVHELIGLVGGNGSGKSTILRAVSGMIRPRAGRIIFAGEDVGGLSPHHMAVRGLAHVPMGRQLFDNMSVEENLLLGAHLPHARVNRAESFERVYNLFPDLQRHRRTMAGAMSGGQQQMVAIGRALMLQPKMLLMDEPSLGLAPLLVREVMQVIRRVSETGIPILLVEQNVAQVLKISDRAYVLDNGHLVVTGPSAGLLDNPLVRKAYLGL